MMDSSACGFQICLEMLYFANYSSDGNTSIVRETWARLIDQALSTGGIAEACSVLKGLASTFTLAMELEYLWSLFVFTLRRLHWYGCVRWCKDMFDDILWCLIINICIEVSLFFSIDDIIVIAMVPALSCNNCLYTGEIRIRCRIYWEWWCCKSPYCCLQGCNWASIECLWSIVVEWCNSAITQTQVTPPPICVSGTPWVGYVNIFTDCG